MRGSWSQWLVTVEFRRNCPGWTGNLWSLKASEIPPLRGEWGRQQEQNSRVDKGKAKPGWPIRYGGRRGRRGTAITESAGL